MQGEGQSRARTGPGNASDAVFERVLAKIPAKGDGLLLQNAVDQCHGTVTCIASNEAHYHNQ